MAENKKIEVAIVGGSRGSGKTFKQQMGILEELQAYRALGTVEELKSIKASTALVTDILAEFSTVGTIEEFKILKDKQKAEPREVRHGDYFCPECGSLVNYQGYCHACGQKVY